MTGKPLYDFFMGAALNPRVFGDRLDLKMWSELRVSWRGRCTLKLGRPMSFKVSWFQTVKNVN